MATLETVADDVGVEYDEEDVPETEDTADSLGSEDGEYDDDPPPPPPPDAEVGSGSSKDAGAGVAEVARLEAALERVRTKTEGTRWRGSLKQQQAKAETHTAAGVTAEALQELDEMRGILAKVQGDAAQLRHRTAELEGQLADALEVRTCPHCLARGLPLTLVFSFSLFFSRLLSFLYLSPIGRHLHTPRITATSVRAFCCCRAA